jgi:hypothetical protein
VATVSRRSFMRVGGLAGLHLFHRRLDAGRRGRHSPEGQGEIRHPDLQQRRTQPHRPLGPEARSSGRRPRHFRRIKTNVSGIRVSELLPRRRSWPTSTRSSGASIHKHQGHNSAMYWSIVGRPYPVDSTLINPGRTDMPSLGHAGRLARAARPLQRLAAAVRDHSRAPLRQHPATSRPASTAAVSARSTDPVRASTATRTAPTTASRRQPRRRRPVKRLEERQSLLEQIDWTALPDRFGLGARARDLPHEGALAGRLGEMQKAFDLSREPEKVRERYGRHKWGQSASPRRGGSSRPACRS